MNNGQMPWTQDQVDSVLKQSEQREMALVAALNYVSEWITCDCDCADVARLAIEANAKAKIKV